MRRARRSRTRRRGVPSASPGSDPTSSGRRTTGRSGNGGRTAGSAEDPGPGGGAAGTAGSPGRAGAASAATSEATATPSGSRRDDPPHGSGATGTPERARGRLPPSGGPERVHRVGGDPLAPAQRGKLENHRHRRDDRAGLLDQRDGGPEGAAGGQHVVDDQHPLAGPHG